jgi:UDP-N-acetylmuramoyl-tripeptide--D-alanyl-D-alanine ligase
MEPVKLSRIIGWCKGNVRDKELLNLHCSGISTDTRTIKKGDIFVAIKGENFDGHDFMDTAIRKGAVAVISAGKKTNEDRKIINVKDTQKALGDIARGYRKQFNTYVIGVTGSDGKTTTKEFLKKTLSVRYNVKGTEGNLNNHLGLPLSIFNIDKSTDFCILEMGMNKKNELLYLGGIARPQAGVITNVASAHLGFFKNGKELAHAKSELIETLQDERLCLLNYDSVFFNLLREKAHTSKMLSFGLRQGADIRGNIKEEGNDFFTFTVSGEKQTFRINFWNSSIIYPALVAFAISERFNISPAQTAEVFAGIKPLHGRGFIHKTGGLTVIDETYNANPNSVRAALHSLSRKRFKRKIAVLGDMAELGRFSSLYHRNTGLLLKKMEIDRVITFGEKSRIISEISGKQHKHFEDIEKLNLYISGTAKKRDVFLIKGSRVMQMERIVNHLMGD